MCADLPTISFRQHGGASVSHIEMCNTVRYVIICLKFNIKATIHKSLFLTRCTNNITWSVSCSCLCVSLECLRGVKKNYYKLCAVTAYYTFAISFHLIYHIIILYTHYTCIT